MSPNRKNYFGIIEEVDDDLVYLDIPRIQDSIINAINSSNEPNKDELIMALRMINRNFYRNIILDDLSIIKIYIDNSPNPNWNVVKDRLTSIHEANVADDLSDWTPHDWAIHLTFSQYAFYLNKRNADIINVIIQQFNMNNSIIPHNRALMNYHIFMRKPNKTIRDIYNFFIHNFSLEQMEFIGF